MDLVPDIMGAIISYCREDLVRWIVEAGLIRDDALTMREVRLMTESNLDITLALMISIDEDNTFHPPNEYGDTATKLSGSAQMDFKTFVSRAAKTPDKDYGGPALVEGHNWSNLKEVRFKLFVKDEASNSFQFRFKGPCYFRRRDAHP
ncbi:hypothetical protein DFH29DRAFT_60859 [Suillus ampliporus]|nr:hypothetical protein DFH29DRAFT_60859 [Suillus ampliporus]